MKNFVFENNKTKLFCFWNKQNIFWQAKTKQINLLVFFSTLAIIKYIKYTIVSIGGNTINKIIKIINTKYCPMDEPWMCDNTDCGILVVQTYFHVLQFL